MHAFQQFLPNIPSTSTQEIALHIKAFSQPIPVGQPTAMNPSNAGLAASLMEIERDRLLCSLQHLERSVKELKQAIAEDPDPEYKAAISEDLVVIAKQRARVQCLEDEIKRAKGMTGDISHSQLAAVSLTEAPTDPQLRKQQQRPPQSMDHADVSARAGAGQADTRSVLDNQLQQSAAVADMDMDAEEPIQQGPSQQQAGAAAAADSSSTGDGGLWL